MTGRKHLGPLILFLGLSLMGCGGGSPGSGPALGAGDFTVAAPKLTLPVPVPLPAQNFYPAPYAGTVTVQVTRPAGFTGAVSLALGALPDNVQAQFDRTVVPAGSTSAVLSVQAGHPADSSFTTEVYPALGQYHVALTASAPGFAPGNGSLALDLVAEPPSFGLAFLDASRSFVDGRTNIALSGALAVSVPIAAYTATGSLAGTVTLGTRNLPAHLLVSFDAPTAALDSVDHTVTFQAEPGLPPGTYAFQLTASLQGTTRALPVVLTYSPYPFAIRQPMAGTVWLVPGGSLSFPVHLWHADAYYGTVEPAAGSDPAYQGGTDLSVSVSGQPAGLHAAFAGADASGVANPSGAAAGALQLAADAGLAPGTYALQLQATRSLPAGPVPAAAQPLTVVVPAPADPPAVWIQQVEWGQTVLQPDLPLVGGKPALLRVGLLADRPGQPAPALTATLKAADQTVLADHLPLAGPGTVPTVLAEGDLPVLGNPSASSYTVSLPGTAIQPGMSLTLEGLGAALVLSPEVQPGSAFELTAVPIIHQGLTPTLPDSAVMASEIAAFWPVRSVDVVVRPPYTTATSVPSPSPAGSGGTDPSGAGWAQLLGELAQLKVVDQSSRDYYGFFNPALASQVSSTIVGLSFLGVGAGIGIDETAVTGLLGQGFSNPDQPLDMAATVMVHEIGHALNLQHTPGRGAAAPQLDYPYLGSLIGTWGWDPSAQAAHDPALEADIMSYVVGHHWVSDWNYLSAMGFLAGAGNPPGALVPDRMARQDQWVVSGWVGPDGVAHLLPLVRALCVPQPPARGSLRLILGTAAGSSSIPFAALALPDLPPGHRGFCFTVPAGAELATAAVETPDRIRAFRRSTRSLAERVQAVAAGTGDGTLAARESGGMLHLEWDPALHPYVNVMHEGAQRTTLALHLTGGRADLPVTGLPAGGRFVIHYSDGLNPVVRSLERTAPGR